MINDRSSHSDTHDRHDDAEYADLPPWQRPAEPDHPMLVEGGVTQGDTELMFRCMVEEYLLAGHSINVILEMCTQPNYQAFYAATHTLGRERAEAIAIEAATRVGRHRVNTSESTGSDAPATLTIGATNSDSRNTKGA